MHDQKPYWESVAAVKTFTHPLNQLWLEESLPRSARILDYGCGYGRAMAALEVLGYRNLLGMDFSPAMLERARQAHPGIDLREVRSLPTAEATASFDAVLLLAVLTSIPGEAEQDSLMQELRRLLRPGGILLLSDMPLQGDARSLARYERNLAEFQTYGVFRTDDGAVVRHHDAARLDAVLRGFDVERRAEVKLHTMNGHAATAVQILARRRAA